MDPQKNSFHELCLNCVSTQVRTWAFRVCPGLARPVKIRPRPIEINLCRVWQRPILSPSSKKILEAPMELQGAKANVRPCAMLIVAIVCSIAFYTPVAGQSGGDPAKAQMEEMNRRELQLNNLGGDKGHSNDPKRSQAMMDQVSEDFQRILTRHNEIVRALASNQP